MDRYRATTSTGAVLDQPSVGALAELVAEVDRSGRHGFLFLERRGSGTGEHYLQARRDVDGWVLEMRHGGPAHQYHAVVADAAIVFAGLVSWLFQTSNWRTLGWEHVGRRRAALAVAV